MPPSHVACRFCECALPSSACVSALRYENPAGLLQANMVNIYEICAWFQHLATKSWSFLAMRLP